MSAGPTEPSVSRVESSRSKIRTRSITVPPRWVLVGVGAVISGVCLWLAVRRVSLDDVWASIEDAEWVWLVPAVALTYVTLAMRAVRWRHLFLEPQRVSTWESAKAVNVGLLFNNILPARTGEVPRIFALAGRTGISKVEIGGTIAVERVLDVLTIAIAALIAWPWLPDASWVQALVVVCAVIVAGFAVVAVAVWILRQRARVLAEAALRRVPLISDERAAAVAASLARGVHIAANPRRFALALILSALVWIVAALSVLALFPAFDLPMSMSSAWLILVATSLALTVPSTSGGLGVYEAAVQSSLVAAGVATSPALAFALVLHAVNFLPVSVTGALAAWGTLARTGTEEHAPVPARTR
jgi:hypothetical protein